jgi:hypothetical protein
MFWMMGVIGHDIAPGRDDFSPNALFMILWILVGFVFARNIFIGVIAESFSRQQREENCSALMTPEQQQWASTVLAMKRTKAKIGARIPRNPVRRAVYELVVSPAFDNFVTIVILVNVSLMSLNFWSQNPEDLRHYEDVMDAFSYFYYAECVLKIFGLGIKFYMIDPWTRFEFFIVCTSLLEQLLVHLEHEHP